MRNPFFVVLCLPSPATDKHYATHDVDCDGDAAGEDDDDENEDAGGDDDLMCFRCHRFFGGAPAAPEVTHF